MAGKRESWARALAIVGIAGWTFLLGRLAFGIPQGVREANQSGTSVGAIGPFMMALAATLALAMLVGFLFAAIGLWRTAPRATAARAMAIVTMVVGLVWILLGLVEGSMLPLAAGSGLVGFGASFWSLSRPHTLMVPEGA